MGLDLGGKHGTGEGDRFDPRRAEPLPPNPSQRFALVRPRPPADAGRSRARGPRAQEVVGVLRVVVVAGLVLVAVLLLIAVMIQGRVGAGRSAADADRYVAPSLPSAVPVLGRMAIIGDGLALTSTPTPEADRQWPAILGNRVGLRVTVLATPGTGYVDAGRKDRSYAEQARAVPSDTDVVLIFGGARDAAQGPTIVARGVTRTIAAAHERAPGARILIVGPVRSDAVPAEELRTFRRAVRAGAAIGEAMWTDPVGAGWLPVSSATGADGGGLSAADQRIIARRLSSVVEPLVR